DESLSHRPAEDGSEGDITHVYAVARLKDGGRQFEVMSKAQVEAVRAQSKAGKSGPWVSHWEEMAKKTVIRRLFKYLPVSVEIQRAVTLDEAAEAGLPQGNEYVFDGDFEVLGDEPAAE
ncbi:MAG: recombinase RecT, partial [Ectopseudomonas guguanensis]|uniref:recombinase RecT n=1 Tax=Ectopseudomonas guguanensis TaxID=1198456 RepID=UPI00391B5123